MRTNIDETLRSIPKIDVPHSTFDKVDNVLADLENRKVEKNKLKLKSFMGIAAIVAVFALLCGTVLAATGIIDFGNFYNSLFNNPDVEAKFEIGQTSISDGIEITLLSAVVDRYQAYLTIEIRDTKGKRLSDSMSVLNEALTDGIHYIATSPVTYNEAENKATLALTVSYGYNIAELGTATFSIDTIDTTQKNTVRTEPGSEGVIRGSWKMSYAVEKSMQNRVLIAYPDDSPVFSKIEVNCSPVMTGISFDAHGAIIDENGFSTREIDGYDDLTSDEKTDIQMVYINEILEYFTSFERPFLTLDDGRIIACESPNDSFDWLGGSTWFPTDYYDIETLHSITICGVEYFFNGTP